MPKYKVMFEKKGFLWFSTKAIVMKDAKNFEEVLSWAKGHARENGWKIEFIGDIRLLVRDYIKAKKPLFP